MGGCQGISSKEAPIAIDRAIIKDKLLVFNIPPKDKLIVEPIHFLNGAIESVHNVYVNKPVFWFIGYYKIGKSFLINKVFGEQVVKSNYHENTRGELHYMHEPHSSSPIKRPCIVVDTQGFDQILETDDPEYIQDFILAHMSNLNSVVFLVIPKLSNSQKKFITNILQTIGSKIRRLIIIHNQPTYKKQETLLDYKKQVIHKLKIDESKISYCPLPQAQNFFIDHKWHDVKVTHLIGGDYSSGMCKHVIDFMRNEINSVNYENVNFLAGISETFKFILLKYYSANNYKITIDTTICCSGERIEMRKINSDQIESKAVIEWSTMIVNGIKNVIMEYHLSKFTLTSIRVVDEYTIIIMGFIQTRYNRQEIIQQIGTSFKIYRGPDTKLHVKCLGKSGETTILIFHPSDSVIFPEVFERKIDSITSDTSFLKIYKPNSPINERIDQNYSKELCITEYDQGNDSEGSNFVEIALGPKAREILGDNYTTFYSNSLKCYKVDSFLHNHWDHFNQRHDYWLRLLLNDEYSGEFNAQFESDKYRILIDINLNSLIISKWSSESSDWEQINSLDPITKRILLKVNVMEKPKGPPSLTPDRRTSSQLHSSSSV